MTWNSDCITLELNTTMTDSPSTDNTSGLDWCPMKNNTDPSDDSYSDFLQTAQFVTGLLIYPTFCFPGLVGNMLTIIVLSRRNMLTSTNAFLSALAVSDSIKLINDILYFFVILFLRTNQPLGNQAYGYLYPYAHFVFNMSVCVSSWLTVSVAVERYILVCLPTKARAVWSRRRAVMLCTLIYFVMTSLALPSMFRYRTIHCLDRNTSLPRLDVELTELWKSNSFVIAYTWAQNLLRSIIPLVILVVLNTCIIYVLSHTKARKRRNSRHRITIMMIVVILAFLICITPDAILSTVFGFGYYEASTLARAIREITDTLLAINAAINFLIYCAFNQVFRKSFAQLCRSPKRYGATSGVGWVTEMDESIYRRLSEAQTSIFSNNNGGPPVVTPTTLSFDQSPAFPPSSPISLTSSNSRLPEHNHIGDVEYLDSGSDLTRVYDCYQQEQAQLQLLVPDEKCQNRDESIDAHDHEIGIRQQLQLQQHHHQLQHRRHIHDPRRGTSRGLRKSKNSIRRGRNARSSSVKHKPETSTEVVTYIPSDSYIPSNSYRWEPISPSASRTHASIPQEVDHVNSESVEISSLPLSPPLVQSHAETKSSNNNHTSSTRHQKAALKSDNKTYDINVYQQPSGVDYEANENSAPNNEASSALNKDSGAIDDNKIDMKHVNMNMINNDLTSANTSHDQKNGPLKENNIPRKNKDGVVEKKKVTLTVSFSEDTYL